MQLIDLVNAYTAADQMRSMEYYNGQKVVRTERELPFDQAAALVDLSALLKPHYEGYVETEKALISDYAKKDENGNAIINDDRISFGTADDKVRFENALKELQESDVSIDGLPVKMAKPNTVRCSWLEALADFVEFI